MAEYSQSWRKKLRIKQLVDIVEQELNGENYDEGSAHDDIMAFISSARLNAWDYISKKHIYSIDNIADALNACLERKAMKSVVIFEAALI